jgi:hypothetical protein
MYFFIKLVAVIYLLLPVLFTVRPAPKGINNDASPTAVEQSSSQERISFFEGGVSFIPPVGFKPVTKEQLKRKLAVNANPLLIYANADQTGSITVECDEGMNFKPEHLIEIKKFTERLHRDYSGWITSEIVEMNERQWFHFEWKKPEMSELDKLVVPPLPKGEDTPQPQDETPAHYHGYSTIYKGKLLSFNFDAHVKHYPQLRDDYIKSIKSVRIKD